LRYESAASRLSAGLSNATIQQRIIAVRSFYEYLVEDGLRERNPVRRGESRRRGRPPKRGLRPRRTGTLDSQRAGLGAHPGRVQDRIAPELAHGGYGLRRRGST